MFLEIEEMKTVAAEYKLEEITDYDDTIVQAVCWRRYNGSRVCCPDGMTWKKIFSATGNERDAETVGDLQEHRPVFLIRRCNVDILYSRVKETYDRDMSYLERADEGRYPVRASPAGRRRESGRSGTLRQ